MDHEETQKLTEPLLTVTEDEETVNAAGQEGHNDPVEDDAEPSGGGEEGKPGRGVKVLLVVILCHQDLLCFESPDRGEPVEGGRQLREYRRLG